MANVETNIQQRIRLALGTRGSLFRNQVGQLPDPRTGRPVQFGLAKGSADIVGWTTKTITEDDVGKSYAIFTSIEVKLNWPPHWTPAEFSYCANRWWRRSKVPEDACRSSPPDPTLRRLVPYRCPRFP